MKTHKCKLSLCALGASLLSSGALAQAPVFTHANEDANIHTEFNPLIDGSYVNRNELVNGGVSVGDFNADGFMDMYLPAGGTGPEQLLINMGDGTFEDQAIQWGVDKWILGMGSAVNDINKDGYPDLYVVSYGDVSVAPVVGANLLYLNMGPDSEGNFRFEEIAQEAGVDFILETIVEGMGATFGDVNLDGQVDLVVTCWALEAYGTRIFINQGDNTFVDISHDALPDTGMMRAFTPKLIDMNGDRYPELLLTNDFHESRLYINNGKDKAGQITFRDVTDASGIDEDCNGMGASVADFNGDGLLDWYMSNVFLESSTPQCGNTLYMCTGIDETGMPSFENTADEAGVIDGGWGWGTDAGDYDNDGDVDITALNGFNLWLLEDIRMYINDGTANFTDTAVESGLSREDRIHGHGMAHLDYDNDGDLDLVMVDDPGPTAFYRNDTDNGNHWLRLNMITRHSPCLAPMGTGTRVTAYAGKTRQVKVLSSPGTHLSQSEMLLHFGFAEHETVDRIEFEWADGRMTTLTDVATNQILDIAVYHPADLTRDSKINIFDVITLLVAYSDLDEIADIDGNGVIDTDDIFEFVDQYTAGCD
jgi:hypothetical protein